MGPTRFHVAQTRQMFLRGPTHGALGRLAILAIEEIRFIEMVQHTRSGLDGLPTAKRVSKNGRASTVTETVRRCSSSSGYEIVHVENFGPLESDGSTSRMYA